MFTRHAFLYLCGLTLASVLIVAAGCAKEEPATPTPPAVPGVSVDVKAAEDAVKDTAEDATEIAEDVQAKLEAKLAEADKLDGEADKVVVRCASCALGMDGKEEHALEVAGYKLYFCTGPCQEKFAKDTTKSILAMKIPE